MRIKRSNQWAVVITGLLLCVSGLKLLAEESSVPKDETGATRAKELARKISILPKENLTVILMDMKPGETAVMAYADGTSSPAKPYQGIEFLANTDRLKLRLEIVKPEPDQDKTWKLRVAYEQIGERFVGVGGQISPKPQGEEAIPIRHISVPVNTDGVEIHLFPFMAVDGNMGSMLVAIGKDRKTIKKTISLRKVKHFNLDTGKGIDTAEVVEFGEK